MKIATDECVTTYKEIITHSVRKKVVRPNNLKVVHDIPNSELPNDEFEAVH